MIPPAVIRLRVAEGGRKRIGLVFPVFLLWPVGLVLMLLAAPLLVLADALMWLVGRQYRFCMLAVALVDTVCAARGLDVTVGNRLDGTDISIVIT